MPNNLHLTEYCAQTHDIISDSVNVCDAEVTDSNTTCAAVVDLSSTNVYASVVRNVDQHTCYASGCSDEGDRDNNDEMIIRISVMTRSISMSQEVPMRRATLTHSRTTRRGNVYRYGPIVTWRNTAAIPMAYA